ncbi:hypothetical protein HOY82DRAFT_634397 [Tuber indicum]|nr:hypothetical protein HOY82DRAFT_634397 [Tuber indicum]
MEGQIHALQKKTADYEEALKAECEARKEATEALMKEVTVLRPLKRTAVNIRERFFATYRRKKDALRIEDPFIIDSGNLRAHAGDVILEVCLFQNHLISFEETFSDLYEFGLLACWIRHAIPNWLDSVVLSKIPGGTKRLTESADGLKLNLDMIITGRGYDEGSTTINEN